MSIETQVVWNKPTDQYAMLYVQQKAQELIAEGKEVGNVVLIDGDTQLTVNRFWIDTATAEEWISFVTNYNPASAVIINN